MPPAWSFATSTAGSRTRRAATEAEAGGFPNVAYFELAPDWVCEVASPRTARIDRAGKLPIYAREGVGHVWLVDALARTLEVFRLDNGRWILSAVHGGDDVVRAEPFDTVEISVARWWPPIEVP